MGCIKSKTKVVINYNKRNSEALTASSDNAVIIESKLHSVESNNSITSYSSTPIVKIVTVTEGDGDSFQKELKERMNSLVLKKGKD